MASFSSLGGSLGAGQEGPGLRVLAFQARGIAQVAKGDPAAQKTLRQTLRLWQNIDAPYEAALVRVLLARALRHAGDEAGARVETLPVDLAANARSLGAHALECKTYSEFVSALAEARTTERTTVVYIQNDRYEGVPGYESWWDVPMAEVSTMPKVQAARTEWEATRAKERYFLDQ